MVYEGMLLTIVIIFKNCANQLDKSVITYIVQANTEYFQWHLNAEITCKISHRRGGKAETTYKNVKYNVKNDKYKHRYIS